MQAGLHHCFPPAVSILGNENEGVSPFHPLSIYTVGWGRLNIKTLFIAARQTSVDELCD